MPDKHYTLGLSGLRSGFAVSLFEDESLLFAIEEDKLRRFKGVGIFESGMPESRAVAAALAFVRGSSDSVRRVVYTPPIDAASNRIAEDVSFLSGFLDRCHSIPVDIAVADHQEAQMAFAASVAPEADAVLMVGKTRTANRECEPTGAIRAASHFDVVRTVERLTGFLGLAPGQIHHLENMARIGEPRFVDSVDEVIAAGDAVPVEALERALGKPRLHPGHESSSAYLDVAASIQAVLIQRIRGVVSAAIGPKAGYHLALCGGVFHSWSLNDALAAEFPDNRFNISFAPGNAGCAIGGPMALRGAAIGNRPLPFLGPGYSREDVKEVLDNCKGRYEFHPQSEIMNTVCDALEQGKMVGWFGGRCEFGLRALGARSVFTNPANPYACDNLSSYLKKRPSYMSYAVAMTEEAAPMPSPFMSRSTKLPEYFGESPVRLQTVSKTSSPVLHQLLDYFGDRTGVPALLNTSLNYFDEPIACTPRDAVKTFFASGLDMLVMENFVLSKS